MNCVTLIGRLTRDPELRYIPGSGTAVTNFTIAIDRDYLKKDGTKDTDFIFIEAIGKTAEYIANYITKGRLVSVQGSIRVDNYEDQSGEKKHFTKVSAKIVKSLSSNKKVNPEPPSFQAIDDPDIPF